MEVLQASGPFLISELRIGDGHHGRLRSVGGVVGRNAAPAGIGSRLGAQYQKTKFADAANTGCSARETITAVCTQWYFPHLARTGRVCGNRGPSVWPLLLELGSPIRL